MASQSVDGVLERFREDGWQIGALLGAGPGRNGSPVWGRTARRGGLVIRSIGRSPEEASRELVRRLEEFRDG